MITLIDTMGFYYMNFHMAKKQLKEQGKEFNNENIGFFAHAFLNSIHSLFNKYDNIIFCWEGYNSLKWRRDIFPDYKRNRDKNKEEDEYKVVREFTPTIENLIKNYPCKNIKVEGAEADDIIYALCEKYKNEDIIMVLTGDKDLTQLMNYFSNVRMVNPIFRKEFEINENIVLEKAICGDPSDNIPGLFRIGPKTFEKMLNDKNEWNKIINKGNNKKIFEDFLNIVDLRKFPKEIHNKIKEEDEKYEIQFKPTEIEKFFDAFDLEELKSKWYYMKNKFIGEQGIEFSYDNNSNDDLDNIIGEFV